jgi:hypothetical protein
VVAAYDGDIGGNHDLLASRLDPHVPDGGGRWTDEDDAILIDLGKSKIGENPICSSTFWHCSANSTFSERKP